MSALVSKVTRERVLIAAGLAVVLDALNEGWSLRQVAVAAVAFIVRCLVEPAAKPGL